MTFPFTAVAGQEPFKQALILAAIDPAIGGVLISGPRGSAKSTLARGMADIMPAKAVSDQHPSPCFVTLPLGATTDMVVGTLSLEHVLSKQQMQFQPGLLARADEGVLYVDEVNLLPDHLVDLLLDVTVSGVNVVERDGVSHQHAARFVLLGTMNPHEGELRPQLQDRFGLSVQLGNRYCVTERMDIVRLREAFDADPEAFVRQQAEQQGKLASRVALARSLLGAITCNEAHRQRIAEHCMAANVDGLRADIVWLRAAMARAAFCGQRHVREEDVEAVAELVLAHRRNPASSDADQSGGFTRNEPSAPEAGPPPSVEPFLHPQENNADADNAPDNAPGKESDWGQMPPQVQASRTLDRAWGLQAFMQESTATRSGFNTRQVLENFVTGVPGTTAHGTRAGQRMRTSINWFATLMCNAGQWPLRSLRYRRARTGNPVLHLILLDTSASTLRSHWFSKAKGTVIQIAEQVYLMREQLAILGFGNQRIDTLLVQKRAPKSLRRWLDAVPASGGTPMRAIVEHALHYQKLQSRRTPGIALKTYMITDGRTSQPFDELQLLGEVLVIDIEQSAIRRGRAAELSRMLDAHYWQVSV